MIIFNRIKTNLSLIFSKDLCKELPTIAKNIKKYREKLDISQDKLSKLADIAYNVIIKIESGATLNPTIETMAKIAKGLGVSIDDLMKYIMESEKNLVVKNTQNGKGVFAIKKFGKGEIIFEFHGKFFTYKELPTPYNGVEDHYVQLGENLYMGPSGGIDDYFNHSCSPNTGLKINSKKVFLIAVEKIK